MTSKSKQVETKSEILKKLENNRSTTELTKVRNGKTTITGIKKKKLSASQSGYNEKDIVNNTLNSEHQNNKKIYWKIKAQMESTFNPTERYKDRMKQTKLDATCSAKAKWCDQNYLGEGDRYIHVAALIPTKGRKPRARKEKDYGACELWPAESRLRSTEEKGDPFLKRLVTGDKPVAGKRPELHVALAVRQKLLQFDWDVLPHPPYSPDLVPPHFVLGKWRTLSRERLINAFIVDSVHVASRFSRQNNINAMPESHQSFAILGEGIKPSSSDEFNRSKKFIATLRHEVSHFTFRSILSLVEWLGSAGGHGTIIGKH
ncbi:hypothetical protein WN51_02022 [Melipona quadrifasciata]|uniref:Histone-lysine N-methyltransferase SETMAR n=1 Tax=Melipona quadrifasciata TaxID=166423 RepID=A0A0N0BKL1_9HYME|nr:hypothetical protein WN51_02022 [Melipona quadrifasciata]